MEQFFPTQYFDLSLFLHRGLFDERVPVWDALKQINSYLSSLTLGKISSDVPKGAFLEHPELITIEEGVRIESGAYIRGPCYISSGAEVRHGAYIRGNAIIGKRCIVGHATEVKNSVFLDGAKAGHFVFVGDSILGNQVNLGAGTKCANLNLSGEEIVIRHEGRRYDTGLRKFGAILGDETQTGCNTVTNPGSIFGVGAQTLPCIAIGGVIPSGVRVKESAIRFGDEAEAVK